MAHDHDHNSDTYYLDQLCLIGLSGAFAAVCLTMYFVNTEMLMLLLAEQFHLAVLLSGLGLTLLVVVRSVALWRQAGRMNAAGHTHGHDHDHHHDHAHDHHHHHHAHDHAHDHAHCHDHEHGTCAGHENTHEHAEHITASPGLMPPAAATQPHDHTHEHAAGHTHGHGQDHNDDHDHAWAPWRYVVLLVPIMLYLLGLPSRGLSVKGAELDMTREVVGWSGLAAMGPSPLPQASSLIVLTSDPHAREIRIVLDGKAATLDDLKPGMPVVVRRFMERGFREPAVEEVLAGTDAAQAGKGDPLTVAGEVVSVNPVDKELVVRRAGSGKDEAIDLGLGRIYDKDFAGLEALAFNQLLQQEWKGKMVRVLGQFAPTNSRQFTLARHRIQCCGADAVQVSIQMVLNRGTLDQIPTHPQHNDWVQVTGRIDFREQPGVAGVRTVLVVPRPKDIVKSKPDTDPYLR
jgi:hypothetical protein